MTRKKNSEAFVPLPNGESIPVALAEPKTRKVPAKALLLNGEDLAGVPLVSFELLEPTEAEGIKVERKWSMVAHTGQVMHRWWGQLILDLDGAKFRQKMALLNDHSTRERVGFSESVKKTDRGLEAQGKLLQNEVADQILKDSKQGFPFQASLRAEPKVVEEVQAGAKAKVNGREVMGPVTIFREFNIAELTVTVLGADSDTATQAFAGTSPEDVEVEFQETNMTVKTAPEPTAPASPPGPSEADVLKAQQLGAQQERERVAKIQAAADPSQEALCKELIAKGNPYAEAIEKLHADLRSRMAVKLNDATNGPGTAPASAGNREGEGEALAGEEPEQWKKEYAQPRVRHEFMSEASYLAFRRRNPGAFVPAKQLLDHNGDAVNLSASPTGVTPLSFRNIKGDFFDRLDQTSESSWVRDIASVYSTDQPQEEYPWLGHAPKMIKWEGDRSFQQLRGRGITIVNDEYESTIEFRGKDFRRDKSQQTKARVSDLSVAVALLPEELINGLLIANGTAYDGVAFFHATNHVVGDSGVINNALGTGNGMAGGATPTAEQMATNIMIAIQQLMGFKNDAGRPMNALGQRFLVMVPTNLMSATVAALGNEFVGSGTSNTLMALKGRGMTIEFVVNPLLTSTTTFYVFRLDGSVGSFIYQEEMDEPMTLDFTSEHYKKTGKVAFGVSASAGAGYGRFEYAIRAVTA